VPIKILKAIIMPLLKQSYIIY